MYSTYDLSAKAGSDYVAQTQSSVMFGTNVMDAHISVATIYGGGTGVVFGVRIHSVNIECTQGSAALVCAGTISPYAQCEVSIAGICGDGRRDGNETCDDGNSLSLGQSCRVCVCVCRVCVCVCVCVFLIC
jgi:hypothetical protein